MMASQRLSMTGNWKLTDSEQECLSFNHKVKPSTIPSLLSEMTLELLVSKLIPKTNILKALKEPPEDFKKPSMLRMKESESLRLSSREQEMS